MAILPISEKFLKQYDIRAIVDERNEKIGRKIRDNELKRIPYMLIVGEKEAENREVSVREFATLAFKEVGIELRWEGQKQDKTYHSERHSSQCRITVSTTNG